MTSKAPLLQVALALIIGIVAQSFLEGGSLWFYATILLVVLAAIAFEIFRHESRPLLWCAFATLGLCSATIAHPEPAIEPAGQRLLLISRIESQPTVKGRWQTCHSRILAYRDTTRGWVARRGVTLLSLDTSIRVSVGHVVSYQARIYPVDSSYGRYLTRRGIFGRTYGYRVQLLSQEPAHISTLANIRSQAVHKLNQVDSSALCSALIVGDRSSLERDLRRDYARVGVAHVLAISGLHVGILFAMLNLALGWLRLFRYGVQIEAAVVILLLWGYAALGGFSPSVLRAVIMFSLFEIGILLSRSGSSLNTLSAAAIVLLLWDPMVLYDLGFQLSFLAMLGIVTLYNPIYGLLRVRFAPLRWLWSLTVVSLTAQLFTLPLTVYTFGQIPLVGLLLNPIVWFTLPVIIIGGVLFLVSGWSFCGEVAAWMAGIQNHIVLWSASHRWVALEGVELGIWWMLFYYVLLIVFVVLLIGRKGSK